MEKIRFCSVCGKQFVAAGREHTCPACAEERKRNAAKLAKQARLDAGLVYITVDTPTRDIIRKRSKAAGLSMQDWVMQILQAEDARLTAAEATATTAATDAATATTAATDAATAARQGRGNGKRGGAKK